MKNIIQQNKKYIQSIIRKKTGNDNPDIEQCVYIKIWQNLTRYREEGKIKHWIAVITANLCHDYFRSGAFKKQNAETELDNMEISAQEQSFEEKIDSRKRQKIILEAVDSLPKIYREIITLHEFEEYPLEEIAARLKIPLGTVKSRLHNGRQILKNKLSFLQ